MRSSKILVSTTVIGLLLGTINSAESLCSDNQCLSTSFYKKGGQYFKSIFNQCCGKDEVSLQDQHQIYLGCVKPCYEYCQTVHPKFKASCFDRCTIPCIEDYNASIMNLFNDAEDKTSRTAHFGLDKLKKKTKDEFDQPWLNMFGLDKLKKKTKVEFDTPWLNLAGTQDKNKKQRSSEEFEQPWLNLFGFDKLKKKATKEFDSPWLNLAAATQDKKKRTAEVQEQPWLNLISMQDIGIQYTTALAFDYQKQLQSAHWAEVNYLKCLASCPLNETNCPVACLDTYTQSVRVLLAGFSQDQEYDFEREYEVRLYSVELATMRFQSCLIKCSPNDDKCAFRCSDNYLKEIMAPVKLYSIERYSKLTFDALYNANTDIQESYLYCIDKCMDNFMCEAECFEERAVSLLKEAENSLEEKALNLYKKEMSELEILVECFARASNAYDVEECTQTFAQFVEKVSERFNEEETIPQSFFNSEFERLTQLMECYTNAKTVAEVEQCTVKFGEETTIKDKKSGLKFLETTLGQADEKYQIKNKVQDFISSLDQDQAEIIKMNSLVTLMTHQDASTEEDFMMMIEKEALRREQIIKDTATKKFIELRHMAEQSFRQGIENFWLNNALIQNSTLKVCDPVCATQCFIKISDIEKAFSQCVQPKCNCYIEEHDLTQVVNVDNINSNLKPYADFLIEKVNERTISESHAPSAENLLCNFECGSKCLTHKNTPFEAKEACLEQACKCSLKLIYRSESSCDTGCGSRCFHLTDPTRRSNCISQCGCDVTSLTSLQASRTLLAQESTTTEVVTEETSISGLKSLLLVILGAAFVVGTILSLRRVKKLAHKHDVLNKPSELKRDRKAKMIDEEDSFVIEETYEKVF